MTALFYLGPEQTFSHEAARRFQVLLGSWSGADLVACPSAGAIYERVLQEPGSGAVVPIFNREQGVIFDFSRFFLLHEAATLELPLAFFLFSRAASLADIDRIYTKDTIVPQVSRWLAGLPPRIQLIARQEISSAEAARLAAEEPRAAAICSEPAGRARRLNLIAAVAGNRDDNFTRFALFIRPAGWWTPPVGLFDPVEFPLGFDDQAGAALYGGEMTLYWTAALSPQTVFHLGHLTALLTLRKFARRGNRVHIFWRPTAAGLGGAQVARFEQTVRRVIDAPHLTSFAPDPGEKPADWVLVAGLEMVSRVRQSGRRGIFLDHVPGRDGYAKMSTRRANVIPWPLPESWRGSPAWEGIAAAHFDSGRLRAAGWDGLTAEPSPEEHPS